MTKEHGGKPDRNGQDGGVGAGRRVVCGLTPFPIIGGEYMQSGLDGGGGVRAAGGRRHMVDDML